MPASPRLEGVRALVGLDEDAVRCPYPAFDAVRGEHPVVFVPEIECWLLTRYADIVHVARHPELFCSIMPTGPILARQQGAAVAALVAEDPAVGDHLRRLRGGTRVLISADPPDHVRQRKLVNRAFTPPRVRQLEPRIEALAHELIDAFVDGGRVDIVSEYAVLLPLTIIAECLGVADDELHTFKRWSDDFVALIGNHETSRDQTRSLVRSQQEFYAYFSAKVAQRRLAPTEDLISTLVEATLEDEPLTDDEILGMLSQFLVAGNETTTKLIASSVRTLVEEPERQDELRRDPSAVAAFVEEVLRLEPPVQGLYRTATQDTVVGGVPIAAGEHLLLMWAAGNRDGERFAEPECLRPGRESSMSHLSFGHGEHFCLGAALARAEGRIAVQVLLERLQDLRLPDGVTTADLRYEPSYVLHGLRRLDVAFTARDRAEAPS